MPGAGEAFQRGEEEGQEGEKHPVEGAAVRTQFSRLRLQRSTQAREQLGQGGGRRCHGEEYI